MSNQRAGKTHRAALGDGMQDMRLKNFFRDAADILHTCNEPDAAFYFEQICDWIMEGKQLPSSRSEISKVLGV